ncbi:high frequency lysogenization protein HflD [Aliidiomarina sanyensis]|uniref:high frequency lysogenization protein HflD n=1 Tax=Aliidiomarina sanyensis TaxID=1249555 RepID=UPI0018E511FC|nr:high frequency lysogenization protein HflD [Aliidiomarina sanyensis]
MTDHNNEQRNTADVPLEPQAQQTLPSIWHERMLAFGGICLAAICAQQLARRGEVFPEEYSETLIHSLLETDPDNTLAVYRSVKSLQPALRMLLGQLNGQGAKDVEQTRYVVGILALERHLVKNPDALATLGRGLTQIKRQRDEFDFDAYRIIEHLGKLYSDVISPIGPRIQVNGKPEHLQKPEVQHHIRAMLLAGIRSAVLWRQLGGKRRQIIFSRKRLQRAIEDLLNM